MISTGGAGAGVGAAGEGEGATMREEIAELVHPVLAYAPPYTPTPPVELLPPATPQPVPEDEEA